jgi:hypothetical protein
MSKNKCYRIVRDSYLGYEVQVKKRIWFTHIWVQCVQNTNCNTHASIEDAIEWINKGLPKVDLREVVWVSKECKDK